MFCKLLTVSFSGIEANPVFVEVKISPGLHNFIIVGLPDKSVNESRERIRAGFSHLGIALPNRRIVVSMYPVDFRKDGAHYDLPIALAILGAAEVLDEAQLSQYIIMGSIGLDGKILPVAGVLSGALFASSERFFKKNIKGIICPEDNGCEASLIGNSLEILPFNNLRQVIQFFKDGINPPQIINKNEFLENLPENNSKNMDMSDICGQFIPKRAAEIAAAGKHNLLMIGSPGSGKSMIAQRFKTILPNLYAEEAIETTMIYSIAGMLSGRNLINSPPFRSPHHSASLVAIVGGGQKAKPGEISLAHNGVLFLDEIAEFDRNALEALRQPLETSEVTISRANEHVTYPASIQLIAAMNPCKCGYFGEKSKECPNAPKCAAIYQSKISGPLMERFDIVVNVQKVNMDDLFDLKKMSDEKDESKEILGRVIKARETQFKRYKTFKITNANFILPKNIFEILEESTKCFIKEAAESLNLSARVCHKVIRVARTIADLNDSKRILADHIAESLSYRYREVKYSIFK